MGCRDRAAAIGDQVEDDGGEGECDEHQDDRDHPRGKEAFQVLKEAGCRKPCKEEPADQDRCVDCSKPRIKAREDTDQEHRRRTDHQRELVAQVDLCQQHQSGEEEEFLEVGDGGPPLEVGHHLADDKDGRHAHRQPLQAEDKEGCGFRPVIDIVGKFHCLITREKLKGPGAGSGRLAGVCNECIHVPPMIDVSI